MKQNKIKRVPLTRMLFVAAVFAVAIMATSATGATIFESGSLGPTGLTFGAVPGANITSFAFNGVRFQLSQPIVTSKIGGHFVAPSAGTFFGAIIALDDENDFPNSRDLTTPDVLGSTLLTFPELSDEVFGDIEIEIQPGWYAVAFGSGLFGATGSGISLLNNPDIGDPSFIAFQSGSVNGWNNLINPIFRNYRFVIEGVIVPEPASVGLTALVLLFLISYRYRKTT